MLKKIISLLTVIIVFESQASIPANDLKIPVGVRSGITEKQFNKILDDVMALYEDSLTQHGYTTDVVKNWGSPVVNASVTIEHPVKDQPVSCQNYQLECLTIPSTAIFTFHGGFARHRFTTVDTFAYVTCHEIGHILGGRPIESSESRPSSEGQSDYWGALKCLRKYFDYLGDSESVISKLPVNQFSKSECAKVWSNTKDIAICQRVMISAEQIGKFFAEIHSFTQPQLILSEPTFDNVNNFGYPTVQCRLDTAKEAALCEVSHDEDVDSVYAKFMAPKEKNYNEENGQCISYKKRGARPRCWYKPSWLTEKLVQAILDQNPDEVRFYLISLRADPNRQSSNSNGKWALELANQSGNIEIINLLKANGAKLPTTWW